MASLTIRNLSAEAYGRLRERARRHRRSITQEAATIIEQAVGGSEALQMSVQDVDRVRETLRSTYGAFGDSARLIREDRAR